MEIIAEIGQNHNGDLNLAKEMIHAAKENGAEVAKFQLFDAKVAIPYNILDPGSSHCNTLQHVQLPRPDILYGTASMASRS